MAKFKVGDRVISKGRKYLGPAKIVDETEDEYVVKFDSGARDMLDKDDVVAANARSCNSANPVVAKAMNACARNGEDVAAILGIAESDIKDGDIDDAREALRDIREAAMRKGWGGEWRKLASKVGLNACARNDSVGEIAAEGISLSREALDKLKRAVPMIEKWIASGKGHPNAVADGKRLVDGIKKAVAILNPVV